MIWMLRFRKIPFSQTINEVPWPCHWIFKAHTIVSIVQLMKIAILFGKLENRLPGACLEFQKTFRKLQSCKCSHRLAAVYVWWQSLSAFKRWPPVWSNVVWLFGPTSFFFEANSGFFSIMFAVSSDNFDLFVSINSIDSVSKTSRQEKKSQCMYEQIGSC